MRTQSLEILLVDDNPSDVELTEYALKKMGIPYHLTHVYDGAEALDLLSSNTPKPYMPQLILIDLKLPKISGFELLKRLQEQKPHSTIPVAVLSGSGREEDKTLAAGLGVIAYIDKSQNWEELAQAFREVALDVMQANK